MRFGQINHHTELYVTPFHLVRTSPIIANME